jgi:hypothetical protein
MRRWSSNQEIWHEPKKQAHSPECAVAKAAVARRRLPAGLVRITKWRGFLRSLGSTAVRQNIPRPRFIGTARIFKKSPGLGLYAKDTVRRSDLAFTCSILT